MEPVICKGGTVAEKELLTLIELFMSLLIKLDGIVGDGDVKLKRKMQVLTLVTLHIYKSTVTPVKKSY